MQMEHKLEDVRTINIKNGRMRGEMSHVAPVYLIVWVWHECGRGWGMGYYLRICTSPISWQLA
jgi:hypothetical protein